MTTGRKPLKRLDMRRAAARRCAINSASFMHTPIRNAPGNPLAGPEGHDLGGTERIVRRNVPFVFDEGDPFLVPRQAIEVRTEVRRKSLQLRERANGVEDFRVE